jgi:hypothetical protein
MPAWARCRPVALVSCTEGAKSESGSVDAPLTEIDRLRHELDRCYGELMAMTDFDPDRMLLAVARMSLWAAAARSELLRTTSRAAVSFRERELEGFQNALDQQVKLLDRVMAIRRAADRH